MRWRLKKYAGQTITVKAVYGHYDRHDRRGHLVRRVETLEGNHLAGHLWLKDATFANKPELGQAVVFTGLVYKYASFSPRNFGKEDYSLIDVKGDIYDN